MPSSHIGVPGVESLFFFQSQLPTHADPREAGDDSSIHVTPMCDLIGVSRPWPQPGTSLAIAHIWEIKW